MSSTVYALLVMALLNGKAPVAPPLEPTLAQQPRGGAARVSLALRMDRRLDLASDERLGEPRPVEAGLMGKDQDGRFRRVDRGAARDTRLGAAIRRAF